MYHLITGMNASIGATGTDQVDRVIGDACGCPRKRSLHRGDTRLLVLPTMIGRSVVFKYERNPTVANGVIYGKLWLILKQDCIRLVKEACLSCQRPTLQEQNAGNLLVTGVWVPCGHTR